MPWFGRGGAGKGPVRAPRRRPYLTLEAVPELMALISRRLQLVPEVLS